MIQAETSQSHQKAPYFIISFVSSNQFRFPVDNWTIKKKRLQKKKKTGPLNKIHI